MSYPNEDLELHASPNGDGQETGPPWGKIVEVEAAEVPARHAGPWFDLYRELLLRLEQTPAHLALAVTLRDEKTQRSALYGLNQLFRSRLGKGAVYLSRGTCEDGTPVIYVRRGKHWGTRGLAHSTGKDESPPPPKPGRPKRKSE
jgi:hypothetical protein